MKKLIASLVGISVVQTVWMVWRDIRMERRMVERDREEGRLSAVEDIRWERRVRWEQEHLDNERKITDVTLEASAARLTAEAAAVRANDAIARANEAAEAYHKRMTELLED